MKTVLVINLEVKDNHEEAAVGGRQALQLCQEVLLSIVPGKILLEWILKMLTVETSYMQLEATENWEEVVDDIISNFERQNNRKLVYSISYY